MLFILCFGCPHSCLVLPVQEVNSTLQFSHSLTRVVKVSLRKPDFCECGLMCSWHTRRRIIVLFGADYEAVAESKTCRSRCFFLLYSLFIVYSSISLWTNPTQTSKTSICVFVGCVWQHNHNLQAFWQAHLFLFFGGGVYKKIFYYIWHFSHTASVSDQQAPVPRSGRASSLLFPCMLNPPLASHSLPTSLTCVMSCCFFLLLPLCLASQRSSHSDWQFSRFSLSPPSSLLPHSLAFIFSRPSHVLWLKSRMLDRPRCYIKYFYLSSSLHMSANPKDFPVWGPNLSFHMRLV